MMNRFFKVKAFRPEGKCGYTTVSGALTQDVTNFPLTYDGKQVFVYFPSYGANIIQVFYLVFRSNRRALYPRYPQI